MVHLKSQLNQVIRLIITHSMPFNEHFTVIVRPGLSDTPENLYGMPFNDCSHVFKNPYGLCGPCPGGASSLICI